MLLFVINRLPLSESTTWGRPFGEINFLTVLFVLTHLELIQTTILLVCSAWHSAGFHTQRSGNYSICLSGQKSLVTIFVMKINQVLMFRTILPFCSMLARDFSCGMLGKLVQCWRGICNNRLLSKH